MTFRYTLNCHFCETFGYTIWVSFRYPFLSDTRDYHIQMLHFCILGGLYLGRLFWVTQAQFWIFNMDYWTYVIKTMTWISCIHKQNQVFAIHLILNNDKIDHHTSRDYRYIFIQKPTSVTQSGHTSEKRSVQRKLEWLYLYALGTAYFTFRGYRKIKLSFNVLHKMKCHVFFFF